MAMLYATFRVPPILARGFICSPPEPTPRPEPSCKEHLSRAPGRYRVRCRLYGAMEDNSRITRAPVDAPVDPGIRPAD